MDSSSDFPVSRSPRRELQGPRPTPLKVRKDSHKIRKPPVAPTQQQQSQQQQQQQHNHQHHHHQQQQQLRAPVIIYTVSPKVIHTNPGDFMSLVQRLTGSSSTSSSSSSITATTTSTSTSSNRQMTDHFQHDCGAISPAARYASIEKIKSSPREAKRQHHHHHHHHQQQQSHEEDNIIESVVAGVDMDQLMDNINKTGCLFPGILSPGPNSLPPISPNLFFSPPSDPPHHHHHHNSVSFFHDSSPVLYGNRTFMEGSFMPSPSASSFVSPYNIISPTTPSLDLFNNFFDF